MYVSLDEGKTWNRANGIPEGETAMIFEHPIDNRYVSALDTLILYTLTSHRLMPLHLAKNITEQKTGERHGVRSTFHFHLPGFHDLYHSILTPKNSVISSTKGQTAIATFWGVSVMTRQVSVNCSRERVLTPLFPDILH